MILGEKRYFLQKNATQSTKWLSFLKIWGGIASLPPPGYAYAIPKGDDLVLAGDFTFQSRESPKSCRALQTYNSPGD